jgi:hypothetical protein
MKLSAPTALVFLLSLILLVVGLIGHLQPSLLAALPPLVVANSFWFVVGGYGVLTAGVLFKGL